MMPIWVIEVLICWKGTLVVLQEANLECGSFKHYANCMERRK